MRQPPLSDLLLGHAFALTGEPSSARQRRCRLLRALRTVIRADSDPARQALFANLMQSRRWVRWTFRIHEALRGRWGSTFVIACYGLISFLAITPPRSRRARVLAVAQYENARHQVDRVGSWLGPEECGLVRRDGGALISPWGAVRLVRLLWRGGARRALRIARRVDRRHGLMVSCRAIGSIAWYARATAILDERRPDAVLVSSDSNPEELGFAAAARVLDIPQVFISHAYPTPFSPPLDFTLSILEGEAAVEARRRKGPIGGLVLLAGIEGESAPMDPGRFCRRDPVIGLFTPKAVSWPTLAAIIDDCRRHFGARRIVIRWHPNMLERPRLADWVEDRSGIVETPGTASLADVARECDWVVADENSNVHLPVLKLGIPTIPVRNLGRYPASRSDLYGFVASRIVFPSVAAVREVKADDVHAFFSDGWALRFAWYDGSYLRPPTAIGDQVREAIRTLSRDPVSRIAVG